MIPSGSSLYYEMWLVIVIFHKGYLNPLPTQSHPASNTKCNNGREHILLPWKAKEIASSSWMTEKISNIIWFWLVVNQLTVKLVKWGIVKKYIQVSIYEFYFSLK